MILIKLTSYERMKRMIEITQFHNIKFLKGVECLTKMQIIVKLLISLKNVNSNQ